MNYIKYIRNLIGHEMLLTVGCGIIIEDNGRILLQHRVDEDNWCIPGGLMEIGESFEETVKRETFEESGLTITDLKLFGLYSGNNCFVEYPNKDKVYSIQIIFMTKNFNGKLKQTSPECLNHAFFERGSLPSNLNPRQKSFILDWVNRKETPIIN